MSPPGKTCLVSEIPCQKMDDVWNRDDKSLTELIISGLTQTKWITQNDVFDATVVRLDYAYPILELGFEKHVQAIMDYIVGIENLRLSGRHANFTYSWIHNLLNAGKEIVRGYLNESGLRAKSIKLQDREWT